MAIGTRKSAVKAPAKLETPKTETVKVEAAKVEAPVTAPVTTPVETKKVEAAKVEAPVAAKPVEPVKAAPKAKAPVKAAAPTVAAVKVEPVKVVEPVKAAPAKVEAPKTVVKPVAKPVAPKKVAAPKAEIVEAVKAAVVEAPKAAAKVVETAKVTEVKVRVALDDLNAFNKANVEALVEANQVLVRGVEAISIEVMTATQASLNAAQAAAKALFAAKTLADVVELNREFTRAGFDRFVGDTARIGELGAKVAKEAFAPIASRVTTAVETAVRR